MPRSYSLFADLANASRIKRDAVVNASDDTVTDTAGFTMVTELSRKNMRAMRQNVRFIKRRENCAREMLRDLGWTPGAIDRRYQDQR